MTMKYLLPHQKVTLLKATLNLCDLLTQIKKPCPVNPGHHVFRYHDRLHNLPKVNIMNCRYSNFQLCVYRAYIHSWLHPKITMAKKFLHKDET